MAEFVDERDGLKMAFPPDKIFVLQIKDKGFSKIFLTQSDAEDDGWLITATYEEALAELNAALVENRPKWVPADDYVEGGLGE
jgi:hypothetical protein